MVPAMTTPTHVESLGSWRAAGLLAKATGLHVQPDDVGDLSRAGLLGSEGVYKGNHLYAVTALEALAARADFPKLLDEHRLLNASQAAERMGIRPRDWEYVVAAGWISPALVRHRYLAQYKKNVSFPVYRPRDVDALRDLPGVDWEEVRAVKTGQRSPLREFAKRPPTRAQIIRWFCTKVSHRFGVEVWAWWNNSADLWNIDWDDPDGAPTSEDVAAMLAEDLVAVHYTSRIRLKSESGQVVTWARTMSEPGAAVILDFETTDLEGLPVEVAVIDTAGRVLLDTLVNPGRPISAEAQAVHGISDAMVADAPTWDQVLPQLLEAVGDRTVLAYNAEFDHAVFRRACRAAQLPAGPLGVFKDRWGCLMVNYTAWMRLWRWPALGGGHRALGDTQAALTVLREMTSPYTGR